MRIFVVIVTSINCKKSDLFIIIIICFFFALLIHNIGMSRITIKKLKSYIYLFGVLDLVQQTGTTYNPMVKIRIPYITYIHKVLVPEEFLHKKKNKKLAKINK